MVTNLFIEIGVTIIILWLLGGFFKKSIEMNRLISYSGPLVLRKFNIDESLQNYIVVDIAGRDSGIGAWILTLLGIDPEMSVVLTKDELIYKTSSIFGEFNQVVPIKNISSANCGYYRPAVYLMLGISSIIASIIIANSVQDYNGVIIFLGIVIAIIFKIAYDLSKKIRLSFETVGGLMMSISYKPSVIEQVSIDIKHAIKALGIINRVIIMAQNKEN